LIKRSTNFSSFYEFKQNNSGGYFEINDTLCEIMVIEADNETEANSIAEDLGCYWNGVKRKIDCRCCGNRWYPASCIIWQDAGGENNEYKTVEEYYNKQDKSYCNGNIYCRIFYKDGTVLEITKQ
jgi:hypothetical protein